MIPVPIFLKGSAIEPKRGADLEEQGKVQVLQLLLLHHGVGQLGVGKVFQDAGQLDHYCHCTAKDDSLPKQRRTSYTRHFRPMTAERLVVILCLINRVPCFTRVYSFLIDCLAP